MNFVEYQNKIQGCESKEGYKTGTQDANFICTVPVLHVAPIAIDLESRVTCVVVLVNSMARRLTGAFAVETQCLVRTTG